MSQNENLKAFLDGELSNAESAALRAEIQNNPVAKAELDDLQNIQFAVRTRAKDIAPTGMGELIKRVGKPKKNPWWIRAGGIVTVGAAGFAVFLFLKKGSSLNSQAGMESQQVALKEDSALNRASSDRANGLSGGSTRAMEETMKIPESGPAPTTAPPNRGTGIQQTKDLDQSAKPAAPANPVGNNPEQKNPQPRPAAQRQAVSKDKEQSSEKHSSQTSDEKNKGNPNPKNEIYKKSEPEAGTAAPKHDASGGNAGRDEGQRRAGTGQPAAAPGSAGFGGGGGAASTPNDGPTSTVPGSAGGSAQVPSPSLRIQTAPEEIIVDADDPDAVLAELAKNGWKESTSAAATKQPKREDERVLRLNLTPEAKASLLKKLNSLPKVTIKSKSDALSTAKSGETKPLVADNVSGAVGRPLGNSAKEPVIVRVRKKKSESEQ